MNPKTACSIVSLQGVYNKTNQPIGIFIFQFADSNEFDLLLSKQKTPLLAGLISFVVDFTDQFSNSLIQELQTLASLKSYLASI